MIFIQNVFNYSFVHVIPEVYLTIGLCLLVLRSLIYRVTPDSGHVILERHPIIHREVSSYTLTLLCIYGIFIFYHEFLTAFIPFGSPVPFLSGIQYGKFLTICAAVPTLHLMHESAIIEKVNFKEYYFFYAFGVVSFLFLLSSQDLIVAYILFELQGLCFYLMAASRRNKATVVEAALKYFLSNAFMSCFLILGVYFIYSSLGTTHFVEMMPILHVMANSKPTMTGFYTFCGFLLIVSTILFKLGASPFHSWAIDVYEHAPLSSTIGFMITPKIPLTLFLFKLFIIFDPFVKVCYQGDGWTCVVICGVLSGIIGPLAAIKQKRVKRLLVYSSLTQTGLILACAASAKCTTFIYSFYFTCVYVAASLAIWAFIVMFNIVQEGTGEQLRKGTMHDYLFRFSKSGEYAHAQGLFLIYMIAGFSGLPPLFTGLAKLFTLKKIAFYTSYFLSAFFFLMGYYTFGYYYDIMMEATGENAKAKWDEKDAKEGHEAHTYYVLLSLSQTMFIAVFFSLALSVAFFWPDVSMGFLARFMKGFYDGLLYVVPNLPVK